MLIELHVVGGARREEGGGGASYRSIVVGPGVEGDEFAAREGALTIHTRGLSNTLLTLTRTRC